MIDLVWPVTGLLLVVFLYVGFVRVGERYSQADWGSTWLNRLDGVNRWFCFKFHRLQADDVALPASGGVVLAGNHVSGLDPLLMIASCSRPLRFVIAREQYNLWPLRWFFKQIKCIPVDRDKRPEQAFYTARRALDEGEVVAIFPQGRIEVSKTPAKKLKRGAVVLATLSKAPILPVRLEGIRARGWTFMALLIRSRARLFAGSLINVDADNADDGLQRVERFIYGLD